MSYAQPNKAPEGCCAPRCEHLIELRVGNEPRDRCNKQLPMWPNCGWHTALKEKK